MPLTQYERDLLLAHGVELSTCVRLLAVVHQGGRVKGLRISRTALAAGRAPRPENFTVNRKEAPVFRAFDVIISALGNRPRLASAQAPGVFYAGDMVLGSSTVVESVASGKNAALEADAYLQGAKPPRFKNRAKSRALLALGESPDQVSAGILHGKQPQAVAIHVLLGQRAGDLLTNAAPFAVEHVGHAPAQRWSHGLQVAEGVVGIARRRALRVGPLFVRRPASSF